MVEPDRGSFSLEPFLFADGELVTWADAEIAQSLAQRLPADSVVDLAAWTTSGSTTTAFAGADAARSGRARALPRREHRSRGAARAPVRGAPPVPGDAAVAVVRGARRHAPDPRARVATTARSPWTARARDSARRAERLRRCGVRAGRRAAPSRARRAAAAHARSSTPSATRRGRCAGISISRRARRATWSSRCRSASGRARTGRRNGTPPPPRRRARGRDASLAGAGSARSRIRLAAGQSRVPGSAAHRRRRTSSSTATAPALQPGPAALHALVDPRRRDHGGRAAAHGLHRARCATSCAGMRRYQAPTATCRARSIATAPTGWSSTTATASSSSRWPSTSASRATASFVDELWPAVLGARRAIWSAARARGSTPEFEAPEKRACYGLLPESASHEGYLAHPVHSYWDDFWALRGLGDAADLAHALGDEAEATRIARRCATSSASACTRSIDATIADREPRLRARLGRVGRLRSRPRPPPRS